MISEICSARATSRWRDRVAAWRSGFASRRYTEGMDKSLHRGSCFCGAVELAIAGTPEAMGYCHCESCRRWSASPINAFTLWKSDAVKVTRGAHLLGSYAKTERSKRT
jgi:hypothetical protein